MNGLILRRFRSDDLAWTAELFHRAVREGTVAHYSRQQREAWSPAPPDLENWRARLAGGETFVARKADHGLGFMTLDRNEGFIEFAYVAPEAMGQGVASALYALVEGRARERGHDVLETEASLLAQRFFARQGWRIVQRQSVERRGVLIPNAVMQKRLGVRFRVA